MNKASRVKIILLLGLSFALFVITLRFLSIVRNDITNHSYRIMFNTLNILGSINLILLPATLFIKKNAIIGTLKGGLLLAVLLIIINKVKGHPVDYESSGEILILSIFIGTSIEIIKKAFLSPRTLRHMITIKTKSDNK